MDAAHTIDSHASPLASRSFAWTCAGLLAIAGLLPLLLGWSNGAHLWMLGCGLLVGAALTAAQPLSWRGEFRGLFLLALTVRAVLHLAVYGWARSADGPYLSPDATLYFGQSLQLSLAGMRLPLPPYVYFGTFDCAHYYLFGAARWLAGADLFSLQMVNIILSSLVGPLTYAIARRLAVPYALAVGVIVALYPSLIALSINDLMKDASVIGFFMVGAWATVELWRADSGTMRRVVLVATAVVVLSYVRMSRFYVPAFFEAGLLVAIGVALARQVVGVPASPLNRSAVLGLTAAILLVELIPMGLGWPSSPVMVWRAFNQSLDTAEMRLSAVGMVDRMQAGGNVGPKHSGDLSASGNLSMRASDVVAQVARGAASGERLAPFVQPAPPPVTAAPQGPPPTMRQRFVRIAANGVRKLFGPFPWVMPTSWDARTILVGDYLMFPGMIIWYLLLPLALAGLLLVPWTALRQGQFAYPLLALTAFVGILFLQYLVLNLSYRQREFMFPFLALGAAFVVSRRPASKWPVLGYAAYLGCIVLLAGVHLALRSRVL
ncbi:hypothetical protein TBR22_A39190 [Luteitalea sp. TBR-22]|uniref:hypothetical protein n=1 Tax=Luteitalea sp. TBR-22 TaxID=2802971 RepID=UPI001AF7CFD6|nr:hypothetical protein [Luteitalea sp. TBR-22]BCS34693.1 hypothetical protein TBR22_A39190 [Luteitalea sp. TBR-22]